MIKNAFHFILKVLEIFKFLSCLFHHEEKTAWFEQRYYIGFSKDKVNFKIYVMTSIFGQLIEYNNRDNFLQKSCRKWGMETGAGPPPFLKKALSWVKARGQNFSFNIVW